MTGSLESPPGSVMRLDQRAAESFFVLSEVSRALADAQVRGDDLEYSIGATEIRIALRPKAADVPPAETPSPDPVGPPPEEPAAGQYLPAGSHWSAADPVPIQEQLDRGASLNRALFFAKARFNGGDSFRSRAEWDGALLIGLSAAVISAGLTHTLGLPAMLFVMTLSTLGVATAARALWPKT